MPGPKSGGIPGPSNVAPFEVCQSALGSRPYYSVQAGAVSEGPGKNSSDVQLTCQGPYKLQIPQSFMEPSKTTHELQSVIWILAPHERWTQVRYGDYTMVSTKVLVPDHT